MESALSSSEHDGASRKHVDNLDYRETAAAVEVFLDYDHRNELPAKVEKLSLALNHWNVNPEAVKLPYYFGDSPTESIRIALAAALSVRATHKLYDDFFRLFRVLLDPEKDSSLAEIDWYHPMQLLGWLRPHGILRSSLCQALQHIIKAKLNGTIVGDYESFHWTMLTEWKDDLCTELRLNLLGTETMEAENWPARVVLLMSRCFGEVRFEELFEIITDYPESHNAVLDLRHVVEQANLQCDLAASLRNCLVRRLCHPGANTSQIIDVYISTIKVLRHVDSTDRLLTTVAEPVRKYLQSRQDTVRCIIASLTDSKIGGDLYDELRRQGARPLEDVTHDSDDEEECPDMDWQPPPSIYQPRGTFLESTGASRGQGGGDILAMLVSIYGSKELFVNEYRNMLADKLLQNLDYKTDKEIHTLELLKLRFGELSMRNCEVMIKDMEDSKRANGNIQSSLSSSVVDAAMVSHIFWPSLSGENIHHHSRLQSMLDEFGASYARLKNPRKLVWLNQLGTVELELVVSEWTSSGPALVRKEFFCSPLHATLIAHFEDKFQWTPEELSNETGAPEHVIQKRMVYWVNNRVVRASHVDGVHVYELAGHEHSSSHDKGIAMDEDGDDVTYGNSAQAEEMEAYTSYIVGMLSHLGQLSLKAIHNNLKTVVAGSDIRYNKTPQQLSAFLQRLCKEERLESGPDGMYKLFKK